MEPLNPETEDLVPPSGSFTYKDQICEIIETLTLDTDKKRNRTKQSILKNRFLSEVLNYEKRRERERHAVFKLEKIFELEVDAPDSKLIEDAIRGEVQKFLDALPYQLRTVIVLREYAQFSYREIGTVLGITYSNVKIRIFRARKMLAKIINERKQYVS